VEDGRVAGFVLERGARVLTDRGVRFSVWAPRAKRVSVRLLRAEDALEAELDSIGGGVHERLVPEASAGSDYLYCLDGERARPDPCSRHQPAGVHGASRIVDASSYAWSDRGWRGVDRPDLVLYELHVGTFTEAGTFDAVIEHLPRLRDLGITAVEIMPVAEFPGSRNWGYDGVFPYAPQSTYGGPAGLRRLVDTAHGAGLAVILDVVYNHLGPEGSVLAEFGPYFTDRYRTPWGEALNFDGPDSDEVRRYFVENALYWIAEYHMDGLRLDATEQIYDLSARPFLAELGQAVHRLGAALSRPVHLIAESDRNDPRFVRPPEREGLGLDAQWSDDFHHALHAALTGERSGYYVDFGGVEPLAKALRDRFVYDGAYSRHRRRRHGAPALDVPADRFVVFAQNHDQIGNRAFGERLATLLPPARLRLAAALLLLSPYVPLLFMGEEYGEPSPFLYFVSHGDPGLIEAVRQGRRRECAWFRWKQAVPDPASEETFHRSKLRRELATKPGHAELRALYRDLLRVRREEQALRPGAASVEVRHEGGAGRIVVRYRPTAEREAFAAFHLGSQAAEIAPRDAGISWRLRLSTDDARYGGPGRRAPERLEPGRAFSLPDDTAVLYVKEE
jgi:maltooligosyltrehalose trehalohydrolase